MHSSLGEIIADIFCQLLVDGCIYDNSPLYYTAPEEYPCDKGSFA